MMSTFCLRCVISYTPIHIHDRVILLSFLCFIFSDCAKIMLASVPGFGVLKQSPTNQMLLTSDVRILTNQVAETDTILCG